MQITNAPYDAVSALGASTGDTHAAADRAIDPQIFQTAVQWVIDHDAAIRSKLFPALVDQYWEMRDLVVESLIDENPDDVVPAIDQPEDLATLCGLVTVHIGGMNPAGEPIFGVELGCNWETEHGAGVQFEGLRVVESGDAAVAFTFVHVQFE
jgi:hypothetical protein